jgi:flagellar FliL protein
VEAVRPRVLDIFATYLRALPLSELQDPTALLHVRAQLLRRVQLLTGPDMVEDLLIIDFVIA